MMLRRVRAWRTDLLAWAEAMRGMPYQWGETDCATLARQALAVLFGQDVLLLPYWTSARQAAAIARRYQPERVLATIGAQARPLNFAQVGDIVVADEPGEIVGRRNYLVFVGGALLITSCSAGVHFVALDDVIESAVAYALWEVCARG